MDPFEFHQKLRYFQLIFHPRQAPVTAYWEEQNWLRVHGVVQWSPVRHGAAHHSQVRHGVVQWSPVRHGVVQRSTVRHGVAQHSVRHGVVQRSPVRRGVVQWSPVRAAWWTDVIQLDVQRVPRLEIQITHIIQ